MLTLALPKHGSDFRYLGAPVNGRGKQVAQAVDSSVVLVSDHPGPASLAFLIAASIAR